jgi:uncharacterized membrane protein
MLNETGLGIYFWGSYIWLIVGFITIGVPAIVELYRVFSSTKDSNQ